MGARSYWSERLGMELEGCYKAIEKQIKPLLPEILQRTDLTKCERRILQSWLDLDSKEVKQMDYTKGEWKNYQSMDGDRIIYADKDDGTTELICREVRHYNMNLIAAAPDMYVALWGMVKAWEELHPDLHPNMAKLALAKAESRK